MMLIEADLQRLYGWVSCCVWKFQKLVDYRWFNWTPNILARAYLFSWLSLHSVNVSDMAFQVCWLSNQIYGGKLKGEEILPLMTPPLLTMNLLDCHDGLKSIVRSKLFGCPGYWLNLLFTEFISINDRLSQNHLFLSETHSMVMIVTV